MQSRQTVNVLGINFPLLDYPGLLAIFQQWIASRDSRQVCIANVHTVVTALSDRELRAISNRALVTMDGMPLIWYANLVHKARITDRICGPDLMLKCLDHGRAAGWRHYFLGGKPDVLTDLVTIMHERFPGVDIVGWHSPPFRELSADEENRLLADINSATPDFLWVGLGAPKQEKWIAANIDRLAVPVQVGVGAAFDFHSGHMARAPLWMQRYGLEWLFRMFKDRRLVRRYLATNPVFLALFARDFLLARVLGVRNG